MKQQKVCPCCGQKGYDCRVYISDKFVSSYGTLKCEVKGDYRMMTKEEINFWKDQTGWQTVDG